MKIKIVSNQFPMFQPTGLEDVKDPCPVFDGKLWHMFGSGGTVTVESWKIYHATAPALEGPWTQHDLIELPVIGSGVAAPGVIFDEGLFHMFIQTEFMKLGGTCEHLVSEDGYTWTARPPALEALPGTNEDGIYDPHPAVIAGVKYIVYAGMPRFVTVPQPDVFLARSRSGSWDGPWERMGKILDHEEIPHHNARADPDYEWGIEGPQLVELPDGRILLNATCFLPLRQRGSRQRVFLAVSDRVEGPYHTLGPVLDPVEPGENGHSTVLVINGEVVVFYQSRVAATQHRWRYGILRGQMQDAGTTVDAA
ncbi:MAG: hypothetical protein B7Z10_01710 [Rhodobacterales bacterium 32-66-7]|nr:MAG: hypothetical protein B7Z31_00830 [Rhodobacterales bacterium 12-65-15]OYX26969.1 MAG: hypothetical protein B7Z10_01710 [Rhodobacterales bacterium 32-66-7]